jgi:DNA-binding transcriptional MerR regulator
MGVAVHKSAEAFRTISEVADELDVPQHVLRFWETKFTAVKPLKRGGGRRYYRPDDVDLLRGIRALLYTDGLTIKGVQKLLRERGARYVMDMGHNDTSLIQSMPRKNARPAEVSAPPSNVHPFPQGEARGLPGAERQRFELLLDELLGLKDRLRLVRTAS